MYIYEYKRADMKILYLCSHSSFFCVPLYHNGTHNASIFGARKSTLLAGSNLPAACTHAHSDRPSMWERGWHREARFSLVMNVVLKLKQIVMTFPTVNQHLTIKTLKSSSSRGGVSFLTMLWQDCSELSDLVSEVLMFYNLIENIVLLFDVIPPERPNDKSLKIII